MKTYQTFRWQDMNVHIKNLFYKYITEYVDDNKFVNGVFIKVWINGQYDDEDNYEMIQPVYDWLKNNGATDDCILVEISW